MCKIFEFGICFVLTVFTSSTALASSWTSVGLGGGGGNYGPAMSPVDPNLMMVSSDMGGKFRSTDGGVTWSMIDWHQIARNHYCAPAFHPTNADVVFACGTKGTSKMALLKSTDKGITWNACVSDSAPWGTNALGYIYIDRGKPDFMFVGSNTNAYRSTNGGTTWAVCPTIAGKVIGFLVDQTSSLSNRTCFAATDMGGIYRSDDNGVTWTGKNTGLPSTGVTSFAGGSSTDKIILYCVATTNKDIYKSIDKGETWISAMGELNTTYNYLKLAVADNTPEIVYVGNLSNTYLYKTSNAGAGWVEIFDGKIGTSLVEVGWMEYAWSWGMHLGWGGALGKEYGLNVNPANPDYLMGTNYGETFLTSDGGNTWKQVYSTYADRGTPAIHKKWKSRGLEVTTTWNYYIDPTDRNKHYICYTDIGFARSVDGGETWIHSTKGLNFENTVYSIAFVPESPGTIFAATSKIHDIPGWQYIADPLGAGEVAKSTDYGATWTSTSAGLPARAATSIVRNPTDKYLYVAMYMDGVYRSIDNGVSWEKKSAGLGVGGNMNVYALKRHTDGTLFCLITARRVGDLSFPDAGGLFKSTNKGESWINISSKAGVSGPLYYPQEFDIHPADSKIIYIGATSAPGHVQGGLYRTLDGGESWVKINNLPIKDIYGCTNGFSPAIDPSVPSTIYFGSNYGLMVSTDSGLTWAEVLGIPFSNVQRMTFDATTNSYFVTTFGGGIWKKNGSLTSAISITTPSKSKINSKCYPNTWRKNRSVNNQYKIVDLPPDAEVHFYNSNGVLIRRLSESEFGYNGWVRWDGKDRQGNRVPQGMYIYVIIAGGLSKTGNVAILK
jgi:photosystem II stability/assembly factor-like uncharacterized protein